MCIKFLSDSFIFSHNMCIDKQENSEYYCDLSRGHALLAMMGLRRLWLKHHNTIPHKEPLALLLQWLAHADLDKEGLEMEKLLADISDEEGNDSDGDGEESKGIRSSGEEGRVGGSAGGTLVEEGAVGGNSSHFLSKKISTGVGREEREKAGERDLAMPSTSTRTVLTVDKERRKIAPPSRRSSLATAVDTDAPYMLLEICWNLELSKVGTAAERAYLLKAYLGDDEGTAKDDHQWL